MIFFFFFLTWKHVMDASIRALGYSILSQKERPWVWRWGSEMLLDLCSWSPCSRFFFFLIWLLWVLVGVGEFIAAYGIFSCKMWDLVPWSGIEPGSCIESVESYPWDDQGILPEAHVVYSEHSLLFLGLHTSFLVFPVDEMEWNSHSNFSRDQ